MRFGLVLRNSSKTSTTSSRPFFTLYSCFCKWEATTDRVRPDLSKVGGSLRSSLSTLLAVAEGPRAITTLSNSCSNSSLLFFQLNTALVFFFKLDADAIGVVIGVVVGVVIVGTMTTDATWVVVGTGISVGAVAGTVAGGVGAAGMGVDGTSGVAVKIVALLSLVC